MKVSIIKVTTLVMGLFLGANPQIFAQIQLNHSSVNEHIFKLRDLGSQKSQSTQALRSQLRDIENYGQSLANFIAQQSNKLQLQAYSLNLINEYFESMRKVHLNILNLGNSNEEIILKVLQIESFKRIHNLYFHPTGLRNFMHDQMGTTFANSISWQALSNRTLNNERLNTLENETKERFFPLDNKRENLSDLEIDLKATIGYQLIMADQDWSSLADTQMYWRNLQDNVTQALGKIPTAASSSFGAVAGSIAWREGYLKDDNQLLEKLTTELMPFDLLMEKKAYKFTDLTIPGHWGHVAVYLGTKEQLIEYGLWNLEQIKPFKEHIENGKSIFQVRRWGLVFDSLKDFLNLDEMAVMRVDNQLNKSQESLSLTLEYLTDQMTKEYDFNFDAMTQKSVTCTEIIAFSYGAINWPMDQIIGRTTISPNNMAELAFYKDSPLKTIHYITGDENGTHFKSEQEYAQTLGYVLKRGSYAKENTQCQRDIYRHRRQSYRFQYSCESVFDFKEYQL